MTPMFWWFALVDEKGLYGSYRALDRFGRDEDRRGMTSSAEELAGPGLFLNLLRNDSRVLVWGYDSTYYLSSAEDLEPREIQDFQLTLAQLTPGEYDVEYWDCGAGEVLKRDTVTVTARTAPLQLAIPAFRGDFALKLRLRPRSE
jgi:hypothetical protein